MLLIPARKTQSVGKTLGAFAAVTVDGWQTTRVARSPVWKAAGLTRRFSARSAVGARIAGTLVDIEAHSPVPFPPSFASAGVLSWA